MTPLRYFFRQLILPFVKTFINTLQSKLRHPILDKALMMTAVTVTYDFNSIIVPFMCWFASPELARGFTLICRQCTYWTGFVKDYLCLPRPPSPPIIRLANSEYHGREYGFPSTHTTTAVAYALFFY
ncbi:hypothetical protein BGZ73_000658, partial [Actinomortierella ambigua]